MKRKTILLFGAAVWLLLNGTALAQEPALKTVTEYQVDKNGKETIRSSRLMDAAGNVLEETEYDEFGKLKDRVVMEYDGNNRKVREVQYGPDNKILEISLYEYDGKGNRILKTTSDESGKVKSKKRWAYVYH